MNLASPSRMVYNAVVVAFISGVIAYAESPDGVTQPGEYVRWVLEVAGAYPQFAVPVAALALVVVLFGESSGRGIRIGNQRRR